MSTINILAEDLISLADLASTLPCPPSAVTMWRWHAKGVNGARLDTVRVGRRRFTTRSAFARFVHQQSLRGTASEPSD